jgi:hypothetical protein
MKETKDSDLDAWEEDVAYLVNVLKESFESTKSRYFVDEMNDALYIELEGLQDYTEDEIMEIAEPIFEELDLDFEDIVLLPFEK